MAGAADMAGTPAEYWSLVATAALFWLALHYGLYRVLRGGGKDWIKAKAIRLALLLSMTILATASLGAGWLPWMPLAQGLAANHFGGIGVIAVNGVIFLLVAALGVAAVRALARRARGQSGS